MAHENLWGTLSTISTHLDGAPFGQPKSFVDGSISNSTGDLYFYDSDMDESMKDVAEDSRVSFSLSSAALDLCGPTDTSDPENPTCARAVFSGTFKIVTNPEEVKFAKDALFERHPMMVGWPDDHSWKIHKINISEIWFIDIYGGAKIVDIDDYYAVEV